jgi:hypothetical protein
VVVRTAILDLWLVFLVVVSVVLLLLEQNPLSRWVWLLWLVQWLLVRCLLVLLWLFAPGGLLSIAVLPLTEV